MGTHPSNPSKDLSTGRTLLDLLEDNQALLSQSVTAKYGPRLPFLFKVLSIGKALSIQAHPNKALAEELHARDPQHYPDDNHKPEMAIAITPFEGLCGFRPLSEISHFISTLAPLKALVGEQKADDFTRQVATPNGEDPSEATVLQGKKALKDIFGSLMTSTESELRAQTESLVAAAKDQGDNFAGGGVESTPGSTLSELVVRLHTQFGSDIGIFVLFFLNYVTLEPGEALFLRADDIHAYVSGDIIECMAASDNVVRAGLTPKFKDVTTLVDMLTYDFAPIEEQKMDATEYPYATLNRTAYSSSSTVLLYDPPIDEFSVVRTLLRGGGAKATLEPLDGPSVVICTAGKGTIAVGPTVKRMQAGHVFFVGATAEVVLQADVPEDDEFITFKAFCEVTSLTEGS